MFGPPSDRDLLVVRYRATGPDSPAVPEATATARVAPAPDDDAACGEAPLPSRHFRGERGSRRHRRQGAPDEASAARDDQPAGPPAQRTAPQPLPELWIPGAYGGDHKCRDGANCTYHQCGFAHPVSWHVARSLSTIPGPKGKCKGKPDRSVKGPAEIEDRSFHRVDGVTGQRIGRRRQNAARAREQFFGTVEDADGNDVINDYSSADE